MLVHGKLDCNKVCEESKKELCYVLLYVTDHQISELFFSSLINECWLPQFVAWFNRAHK